MAHRRRADVCWPHEAIAGGGRLRIAGSKLEEDALYKEGMNLTARVRAPQVMPRALSGIRTWVGRRWPREGLSGHGGVTGAA